MEITRAFIALDLHDRTKDELSHVQDQLRQKMNASINWVPREQLHITLAFLNNLSEEKLPILETVLTNFIKENKHFVVDIGSLSAFPNPLSPRVIWAGLNMGFDNVNLLCVNLEKALLSSGIEPKAGHTHPHITLGRVKTVEHPAQFRSVLEATKVKHVNEIAETITLYKSQLTSAGPIHTPVFSQNLGR